MCRSPPLPLISWPVPCFAIAAANVVVVAAFCHYTTATQYGPCSASPRASLHSLVLTSLDAQKFEKSALRRFPNCPFILCGAVRHFQLVCVCVCQLFLVIPVIVRSMPGGKRSPCINALIKTKSKSMQSG